MLSSGYSEMHFVPSTPESWFSLPRGGGVAYAAQEAWVQNETIRVGVLYFRRTGLTLLLGKHSIWR
jgi:hypothetical protein